MLTFVGNEPLWGPQRLRKVQISKMDWCELKTTKGFHRKANKHSLKHLESWLYMENGTEVSADSKWVPGVISSKSWYN